MIYQSKSFFKLTKDPKSDMVLKSHKLLYQAGFIRESRAGRYYLLPLGLKVQEKICKIIEEELAKIGAQKMFAPVLHPLELWKETNRDQSGGYELMTVQDRAGAAFALGGTAEEMFVDLMRQFQVSYKELPINLYQFGYKFRDELRARGGLLRMREFLMKDAYSFHASSEDFTEYYEQMLEVYTNVFRRLDLPVKVVPADNGYFGGEYSHEFIVDFEAGESAYFEAEDGSYIAHEDIASQKYQDLSVDEAELPLEIVGQPEWVKNMEDNLKHYKLPLYKFLKNVVFKNKVTGDLWVAVTRGDLEVNKNKLEKVLNMVGLLEEASVEDLKALNIEYGYVKSFNDDRLRYVADDSLKYVKNMVGGQKSPSSDTINVNYGRDFKCEVEGDISLVAEGAIAESGSKLIARKGIEVANTFQLGTHYTDLMSGATFSNKEGGKSNYFMGCYGIGIGRSLATIVEVWADEKGLVWPKSVTPFEVHIVLLGDSSELSESAHNFSLELEKRKLSCLIDDRDLRAGAKFAEADLVGIPARVVVSEKLLREDKFELKFRTEEEVQILTKDELINLLVNYYA